MLRVVADSQTGAELGACLDEIVREGARRMLAVALEAEVDAYVSGLVDEVDEVTGKRLVVRNGHAAQRCVATGAGPIEVRSPRVNDRRVDEVTGKRYRFRSSIVPPWARKSPKVAEVLPLMYLHGMSSGDFAPALSELFGSAAGLSASVVTRLTAQWQEERDRFSRRSLAEVDYVYVWVDGIHFNVRLDESRLCALVIVGVRADGTKELVSISDGQRESTESWADVLRDLKRRGMRAPVVAVGDGALGFWSALGDVFPDTVEARCWVHKAANVLNVLPKSAQPAARRALAEIRDAEDRAHALEAIEAFRKDYEAKWPKAVAKIVSAPRPAGTVSLPGDAASLRFYDDPLSGACMIHDPHRQTLAVALRVAHPAYVLLSPDDQRGRVSAWGRVLASLAQSGTCAAIQVLEQTVPDPGTGVAGWYEAHGTHSDDWPNRQYQALLAQSSHGSSTHRTTITIALDLRAAARAVRDAGRGVKGAAVVLRGDMTALEHSVRAADLRIERWLAGPELALMVRHAYDPEASNHPGRHQGDLGNAGPVGVSEHWSWFRHDSAFSAVLWISDWPRIDVPAHFLHSLIFAPGVRKSLSVIARPLGTTEALKQIRKEKTEAIADTEQKAKIGQIADLSDAQEYADVLARERALISGHADIEFSGFISVTALTQQDLTSAVALIERSATQSGCETRILYGHQTQGFVTAALPFARGVQ